MEAFTPTMHFHGAKKLFIFFCSCFQFCGGDKLMQQELMEQFLEIVPRTDILMYWPNFTRWSPLSRTILAVPKDFFFFFFFFFQSNHQQDIIARGRSPLHCFSFDTKERAANFIRWANFIQENLAFFPLFIGVTWPPARCLRTFSFQRGRPMLLFLPFSKSSLVRRNCETPSKRISGDFFLPRGGHDDDHLVFTSDLGASWDASVGPPSLPGREGVNKHTVALESGGGGGGELGSAAGGFVSCNTLILAVSQAHKSNLLCWERQSIRPLC